MLKIQLKLMLGMIKKTPQDITNYNELWKEEKKIQRESGGGKQHSLKHLSDMIPEVLFDPRNDKGLMARVSEPNARNMKGGFRHDPYQSGTLHTPTHKRAYLGAHAKAPIIYIDELKTLVKIGYMADLLEIMQNKEYIDLICRN